MASGAIARIEANAGVVVKEVPGVVKHSCKARCACVATKHLWEVPMAQGRRGAASKEYMEVEGAAADERCTTTPA